MEKVVYFLGAGFSAPLGLPVMSNFLEKSKDLYFKNPVKYNYFKEVFEKIQRMSFVKNYYDTNLFNIEEILSILEMENQLFDLKSRFIDYIVDVIENYTSPIPQKFSHQGLYPFNFIERLFARHIIWKKYAEFVYSLFNLKLKNIRVKLEDTEVNDVDYEIPEDKDVEYSIITLNYDLVLEKSCEILNNSISTKKINFFRTIKENKRNHYKYPYLSKLHGDIDKKDIVAPTWNKTLNNEIKPEWTWAFQLLKEANYIRIIGYSLPINDSYIKYLLRSSVIYNPHLKRIDIICLNDESGNVKIRYDEFIKFNNKRFISKDVLEYLECNSMLVKKGFYNAGNQETLYFDKLEEAHESFFKETIEIP